MKNIFHGFNKILLVALLSLAVFLPTTAPAATPNYDLAIPGIAVLPFHLSGQYTATATGVVKFNMPFKCRVLNVMANARASGGTSPTLTVDVLEAGASILSSAISITAGTVAEGTISDASIADEAAVTVNLTIGGTSPTWNDITVMLIVIRE